MLFHNERTQCCSLDPRLMFWYVSDHFVTAQKTMQNEPTWCINYTTFVNEVAKCCFVSNSPNPLRWNPDPCFCAFRIILLLHKKRCKTDAPSALNLQVPLTKWLRCFFITSAPNPLRWTSDSCIGAFRTISLLHEKRCKNGPT